MNEPHNKENRLIYFAQGFTTGLGFAALVISVTALLMRILR